ncbi:MAG: PEP-CTERM sorting domain-containing protein [Verrucomicrobiota bacterium]
MNGFLRCLLAATCLNLPLKAAITLNQLDDFSGIHDWTSGDPNPNPPVIRTDAGPLGSGDSALRVSSNGSTGPGGRLIVFNETLWTGNYTAAGIQSLAVDLRNLGNNTLSMRVAVNGAGGWFVTPATPVTAFSGWTSQVFDLHPSALVSAGGANATLTLAAVSELRILHSATADYRGARVSSEFMVDNIRAIPEPSTMLVCGLALFAGFFRKR